ncbi:MAG: glycosyltransferase [Actinomycetota bacterium]
MTRKILYLIDSLGTGGAERGLALTLRYLDRRRFEPEVAYLWPPSGGAEAIRGMGITVHYLGASRGPGALMAVPKVVRLLRKGGFDAVHTQVVWASIVGRIAGKLSGVKVISHVVSTDPSNTHLTESPRGVARKARMVDALDEVTGRFLTDRFVAITEAVSRNPIRGRSWKRDKFSVVLRGQDLEALAHGAVLEPGPAIQDPGSPSLLAVGQIRTAKGHGYLLEAMPRVLMEYPNAKLLIAGGGHLAGELANKAASLGDRVELLGVRDDVPSLMARCDVFVFPSLWEGQGNALIEAMAVGGPIVATRIPAVEETLSDGDTAVLVPPGDPAALAEGILRLLGDPAGSAEMAEGAAHAAARFDIHRTTRDLETVYDKVMPGG